MFLVHAVYLPKLFSFRNFFVIRVYLKLKGRSFRVLSLFTIMNSILVCVSNCIFDVLF